MLARQGASLLCAAGLTDRVASDANHYVDIAVKAGSDLNILRLLREQLRPMLMTAAQCDGRCFAAALKQVLRDLRDDRDRTK